MLDRTYANFFAAFNEEVSKLKKHDDVYNLMFQYDISVSFELSAFTALSKLIVNVDEKKLLIETEYKISNKYKIYQCDGSLVSELASYSEESTNALAYKWREVFWSPNGLMEGLGIWSHLFSLRFVCSTAVKEKKNLYVVNDYVESNLER